MSALFLYRLSIADLRNLTSVDMVPHPRFNVIAGRNGMGKTNLLEAIYLLGALRSFRTATRAELLRHGHQAARVLGIFGGPAAGLRCEVLLSDKSRRIRVDDKALSCVSEHFHRLPMVLFHPATMSLVSSGPETRRRFLDRALFQADPTYPQLFSDYAKALVSRNRLLRGSTLDRRSLVPYDEQLARLGTRLSERRRWLLGRLSPMFEETFCDLSGGLIAKCSLPRDDWHDVEQVMAMLRERYAVDTARGYTTAGPHAQDMDIVFGGQSARRYASQGQQRLLALSLKISEVRALTEATGRIPILLLDDVSSELDRERNQQLFSFLRSAGGQVFITTTHVEHILLYGDRTDYEMKDGRLTGRS
ncbi:MAG: DNA replication/repair protein RecF [Myxococcota bacterium]|jgi:DNA replication and repair protein RecF|nr:DNA replication/repair protein RecF [Myxococcota bacterium]